jgi:hypothetical protein
MPPTPVRVTTAITDARAAGACPGLPGAGPGWTARRPQDRAGHGSRSGNYLVQHDTPAGASQQANWKWRSKCQGLTYAMPTRPSDGSYR